MSTIHYSFKDTKERIELYVILILLKVWKLYPKHQSIRKNWRILLGYVSRSIIRELLFGPSCVFVLICIFFNEIGDCIVFFIIILDFFLFDRSSTPQSSVAVQAVPNTNPFGTLPALPQMSIGRVGTTPSIQYGISSMPVNALSLGFNF